LLYLKIRVEVRELELVELEWLVTHHWLTISNLVNKVTTTYINGGHCSRFGDGNHTSVIVVTISDTTWIHAHLWVGVVGGTFGEIILVIGSKCITTRWHLCSNNWRPHSLNDMLHCNFMHIPFHVISQIIMGFRIFRWLNFKKFPIMQKLM
jgi:hypothetical protein